MPETVNTVTAWLTTSGIKILGILISLIILSQISKWDVGRELRKRIKKRFDEKGIQIPSPHRVVLWGNTKKEHHAQ